MHAHFAEHAYHRHSHETYSFGVTERGAQAFTCRGAAHTSAAGMVMAFNPDEPHDGHADSELGFTYRIVHIGPELITGLLAERVPGRAGLPLFREPVVFDPVLADALRALHDGLATGGRLRQDELLADTVAALVRRAATGPAGALAAAPTTGRAAVRAADLVRDLLDAAFAEDLGADDLAGATGLSRYAVYRAFRAVHGMSPSDYQRQARLRAARGLLAAGRGVAEVAAEVGFADQAHLTRWFGRYYGITPGAYRRSAV
ncbi:AraC family transcriptional regulator [Solihabitans fulvus]|uniref:AraC family transcriptional regulator n=2 Tax=Solihabitans fulvus TaxID=1892852 RepID=A0A5B2WSN3_9PSEU|nr:AraC family transcriptional regulator [Solihabitans fulvus]